MAITTEFLIIISKQYQGDKWWEQRESKPSSSSLSQSKISMYTSAVFLGKKTKQQQKRWKNHYHHPHCYYHKRDVFYEKLPRPKNGYNKKSYLSFYKKVTMCNEDPNIFNLLTLKSENLSL